MLSYMKQADGFLEVTYTIENSQLLFFVQTCKESWNKGHHVNTNWYMSNQTFGLSYFYNHNLK